MSVSGSHRGIYGCTGPLQPERCAGARIGGEVRGTDVGGGADVGGGG